jgi:hypothetical protein
MHKQVFTFGSTQTHPTNGRRLDNYFVEIEAETPEEARREMNRRFARVWGSQYKTRKDAGVEKFELRPLEGEDALGLLRERPFYGWRWSVALKLASGSTHVLCEGEARLHRSALLAAQEIADDFHPSDTVQAIVEKASARSAVVFRAPPEDEQGPANDEVGLACGHTTYTRSKEPEIECPACTRIARERSHALGERVERSDLL